MQLSDELKTVLDHLPGAICIYRVEGDRYVPLFYNTAFYARTGCSPQMFRPPEADAIRDMLSAEDAAQLHDQIAALRPGGPSVQHTFCLFHGQSRMYRWLSMEASLFCEADQSEYLYITLHDVAVQQLPASADDRLIQRISSENEENRREKERLEDYFQTLVKNLPGGVSVIRCGSDGSLKPEFLSDGFAEMLGMTTAQAQQVYAQDALTGVHLEEQAAVRQRIAEFLENGQERCELLFRLRKGDGSYLWAKSTLSLLRHYNNERYIYAIYHDVSGEHEKQEVLREKYRELIFRHYRTSDADTLVLGHCNITQGKILEIIDYTGTDLLEHFGRCRDGFFSGLAELIEDDAQRAAFLNHFLSDAALQAFGRGERTISQVCLICLNGEPRGRYAQFNMNMVETPDSGDITGILTVTDVTEKLMTERVLYSASVRGYDFVLDLDVFNDHYRVLSRRESADCVPPEAGCHTERIQYMFQNRVVPRDREAYYQGLEPKQIMERLKREGTYSFVFSIYNDDGEIEIKNISISPVDLRIGRVCLVRSDITASMQEQQGMLNSIAYTFDMLIRVAVGTGRVTMYTRQAVLESLPPRIFEEYDAAIDEITGGSTTESEPAAPDREAFALMWIRKQLAQKPLGYDFVFTCREGDRICYKQINVLWGDDDHQTICMVRADVTELLSEERQSKEALERALAQARRADRAKGEFLSKMSHEIRTPMNAILGMAYLAAEEADASTAVAGYIDQISQSSQYLLGVINDILDMSRIESGQTALNPGWYTPEEIIAPIMHMMEPMLRQKGIHFDHKKDVLNRWNVQCYLDKQKMQQMLMNLLNNAYKFTPAGGTIRMRAANLMLDRDAQLSTDQIVISDTGCGMSEEFMSRLFKPFEQERLSGMEQIPGTGLGLSIARSVARQMEGDITAESKLGKGSTFRVTFTYRFRSLADATEEEQQKSVDITRLKGIRVLLAEDNKINASIAVALLEKQGVIVDIAQDGKQALDRFAASPDRFYDVILMDIQMPVMNGLDATRHIRTLKRADAKVVPIIAMSANAYDEDRNKSLEAGMNAHLSKPVNPQMLYRMIAQYC